MAVANLSFDELFRFARIRELKESILTNDPRSNVFARLFTKIESDTLTQEDFDNCIATKHPEIIKYISFSSDLFNTVNILKIVSLQGYLLGYIPASKQSKEICLAAVKNDGAGALNFVSKDIIDDEIVREALKQNPNAKEVLLKIYTNHIDNLSTED